MKTIKFQLILLLIIGTMTVVSCGPSKAEQEAERQRIEAETRARVEQEIKEEQEREQQEAQQREQEAQQREQEARQREQEARQREREARQRERDAIVGTYYFDYESDGKKQYLVVMKDFRVVVLDNSRKTFIGTVGEINDGVFTIRLHSPGSAGIGAWCNYYKNGEIIGRQGSTGYIYPSVFVAVIDTNTRRIYKSVESFKNKDISDEYYIMYDRFSSVIKESI